MIFEIVKDGEETYSEEVTDKDADKYPGGDIMFRLVMLDAKAKTQGAKARVKPVEPAPVKLTSEQLEEQKIADKEREILRQMAVDSLKAESNEKAV